MKNESINVVNKMKKEEGSPKTENEVLSLNKDKFSKSKPDTNLGKQKIFIFLRGTSKNCSND